jgi:HEAT repeat protein
MSLLREIEAPEVVPLLEKLSRHDELRVRREALRALCEKDQRPGSKMRHLFRGLRDPSPRVVSLALRRLGGMDEPEAIDLLGEYLDADFSGVMPPPDFARRAARGLLAKGKPGIERLCTSLERLSNSLHPRRIRHAAVVAEILKERVDDPQAQRSVRRWRISPSGVAALVMPSGGISLKRPQ